MPSFIIVGYAWQILERGGLVQATPPSRLWASPKKPILNRVKGLMEQFRFFKLLILKLQIFILFYKNLKNVIKVTAWKVSKYGVFSGPYFPVFRLNTGKCGTEKTPCLDTFHAVSIVFMGKVFSNIIKLWYLRWCYGFCLISKHTIKLLLVSTHKHTRICPFFFK